MKNVIQDAGSFSSQAPTLHLGTYRRAIMAVLADEVFTPAERLRANHSVYESQDGARLALWLQNVTRLRDEREAKAVALLEAALERGRELLTRPAQPATPDQVNELKVAAWELHITDAQRERLLTRILSPLLTQAGAAQLLAELQCADPAPAPTAWATPTQCDEVFALASLPCFTKGEKTHTLNRLPTLTQAGAVKVIGALYAAAWRRGKLAMRPENGGSGFKPLAA